MSNASFTRNAPGSRDEWVSSLTGRPRRPQRDLGLHRWGIEQAERYIRELTTACQELADQRRTGRAIDEIREGYFKLSVRILHQRMDLPERLG